MIVNGQRVDEMVGDVNLFGNVKSAPVKELPVDTKEFVVAVCGRVGVFTDEARHMLQRISNDKQSLALTRLEARLFLLRDSYIKAKACGGNLSQLTAQGKQVARRCKELGSSLV